LPRWSATGQSRGSTSSSYDGLRDRYDESKLEIRPVGSFFTEPARLRHFGITKDEGVILYFVGTGPSTNDDPEK
jgi:hypothetical protein